MTRQHDKIEKVALWIAEQPRTPNTAVVKEQFGLSNSRATAALKRGTEIRRKRKDVWLR